MLKINEVYLGDCLKIMQDIDDNSIDMILTDLPYGVLACKWDSVIPLEPMWEQYKRIIKDHGGIVLTATNPFSSKLIMSNPKMYKHEWIWSKNIGHNFTTCKNEPLRVHENILIFGKKIIYNSLYKQRTPYETKASTRPKPVVGAKKSSMVQKGRISEGERYPTTILKYKKDAKSLHPSQKPMLLFAYLIKTYTNPGMLILDSCIGSGTTAIAAMYTGRNFIGIEKEEKYFRTTKARIKSWKKHH